MSVRQTRLANGLRVVTHAMPHLETVALGVWVGVGARHEKAAQSGISHLLEHMAFKGTRHRSARDIAEAIENVGGDINAATSLEMTAYYARMLKEDCGIAIEILSDIVLNPAFDPGELAREKEVILQEIAAAADTPEDLVYDEAQDVAFPDQPAGRPILGTPETVRALDPQSLAGFASRRYLAASIVVSAAGALDHDTLVADVEARFGAMASGDADAPAPARFAGGTRTMQRSIEQTHVIMAFEAPSHGAPAFYAAQVFSGLFGGGMSSRLFQQVREQRGLCYSVYSHCWGMQDTGLFTIYAGTSGELVDELRRVVRAELEDVAANGPSDEELRRSKAQLKAGLLMGLESPASRAEQMARQLLAYDRIIPSEELIAEVDGVDAGAIREMAKGFATADAEVWCRVGP